MGKSALIDSWQGYGRSSAPRSRIAGTTRPAAAAGAVRAGAGTLRPPPPRVRVLCPFQGRIRFK